MKFKTKVNWHKKKATVTSEYGLMIGLVSLITVLTFANTGFVDAINNMMVKEGAAVKTAVKVENDQISAARQEMVCKNAADDSTGQAWSVLPANYQTTICPALNYNNPLGSGSGSGSGGGS